MDTNKQMLIEAIEMGQISEELAGIFLNLSQPMLSKGDLMNMVYSSEELRKVDSAYPQDYGNRMRALNPGFRGEFMVYDYNDRTYGAFENVAELLVEKIKLLNR